MGGHFLSVCQLWVYRGAGGRPPAAQTLFENIHAPLGANFAFGKVCEGFENPKNFKKY
jgi:hypothetical protein